ncbi:MAG: hypothetical protein KBD78_00020 [Oligoflexales bacterium]|nr:hypothetical protein [Oligoflexales bacterium]
MQDNFLKTAQAQIQPNTLPTPDVQGPPHDVQGLVEFFYFDYVFWGAILFLLCLLVFAFVYWWRHKKSKNVKIIPVNFALDLRHACLDELLKTSPPKEFSDYEVQRDYYYRLSLAARLFIELTFHFPATDMTLGELKFPLKNKLPLSEEKYQKLYSLLSLSDLVKFADRKSNYPEAQTAHQELCALLKNLIPKPISLTISTPAQSSLASSIKSEALNSNLQGEP